MPSRRDPGIVRVDARPAEMYSGKTVRHLVQGGHIPGAINIVPLDGTGGQSPMRRGAAELAALYQAIPKGLVLRYLDWNGQGTGVRRFRQGCGLLVTGAGLYLIWIAR